MISQVYVIIVHVNLYCVWTVRWCTHECVCVCVCLFVCLHDIVTWFIHVQRISSTAQERRHNYNVGADTRRLYREMEDNMNQRTNSMMSLGSLDEMLGMTEAGSEREGEGAFSNSRIICLHVYLSNSTQCTLSQLPIPPLLPHFPSSSLFSLLPLSLPLPPSLPLSLIGIQMQRKENARYRATGARVLCLDGGGMKGMFTMYVHLFTPLLS